MQLVRQLSGYTSTSTGLVVAVAGGGGGTSLFLRTRRTCVERPAVRPSPEYIAETTYIT